MTKVSETATGTTNVAGEVDTKFGLTEALASLLRIDLAVSGAAGRETGSEVARSEERVHTPASLVQELRRELWERKLVSPFDPGKPPSPGAIIEFESSLRRNPVLRVLDLYREIMEYAVIFGAQQQPGKGKQKSPDVQSKKLKAQLESFIESLLAGGTVDIVTDELGNGFRAVLTLERQFLRDPSMADLTDGHFTALGKVIRVQNEGRDGIHLMRKTALGALEQDMLEEMFSHLKGSGGFRVPEIEWVVPSPVIHVLPVAVFA